MITVSTAGFDIDSAGMERAIEVTVRNHGVVGEFEVNFYMVGDVEMKDIHKRWMKKLGYKEELHDVVSFPFEFDRSFPDGVVRLGELVVCYEVAVRQALESGRSLQEEVEYLAIHGTKHLLGEHHD